MTVPEHLRTACDLREALQGLAWQSYHYTAYHSTCLGQHPWRNRIQEKLQYSSLKKTMSTSFQAAAEYLMDDQFFVFFNLTIYWHWKTIMFWLKCLTSTHLYNCIPSFWFTSGGIHSSFGTSERYLFYHNFNEYVKLKEPVCFQLNLLAVVGYYGPKLQNSKNSCSRNVQLCRLWCASWQTYCLWTESKTERFGAFKEAIANNQFFK
jgi:hypothetical protein